MSDSENDIDYVEILKTLNEKNIYLHNHEQNSELRKQYEDSFRKYSELKNIFLNMKDEFVVNQIQIQKSNTLLADSRNQYRTQLTKLEEFQKKIESLNRKSIDQQGEFENTVKNWDNKISELSVSLDEQSQIMKMQAAQINVDSLLEEIEIFLNIEEDRESGNKHPCLKELKQITGELERDTQDYEEKLKYCKELEIEINEYEAVIKDIQKQLQ